MQKNEISIEKIIKIIKKIRNKTNLFLEQIKYEIYIETNKGLKHPDNVNIFHSKENNYLLLINECGFILNDNEVKLVVDGFSEEKIEEGNKTLKKNKEVIKKWLMHLQKELPQYIVAASGDNSYMRFEENVNGIKIKGDCNQIVAVADFGEIMTIKYRFSDEEVIFNMGGIQSSLKGLLIQSQDVEGVRIMCESLNCFFKECKISKEKLPIILKTYIETENKKR